MSRLLSFLVAGAFAQQVLEETKACPAGFELLGKQCVQTITLEPTWTCPTGTNVCDAGCVQYFPKTAECPAGFLNTGSRCERVATAERQITCPAGFVLTEEGCVKQVELPCSYACPAGAVAKGDTCYAISTAEPEFACAPGSLLNGNLCITEETYDCTPAVGEPGIYAPECGAAPGPLGATQSALLRAKAKFAATGKEHTNDPNACEICATAPCSCGACGAPGAPGAGHGHTGLHPRFVEETLVSAKCKRIAVEPAAKICPLGHLDGKVCIIETPVNAITVPGGFATETVLPSSICPAGFSADTLPCGTLTCTRVETAAALFTCPCGTEDLGDRCALPAEARPNCPEEFHLANGICVKTIYAEPITEYTVRYTCAGKDCAAI